MEEASRGQASLYPYTGDGEEIYFEIVKIGLDYLDVDPNKRPKFCKTHYNASSSSSKQSAWQSPP